MRIVGIDPGLKATGYAFLDCEKGGLKLLEAGTIEPKAREPIQERIHAVYRNLDVLLEQYHPDVLVLEKLYAHYKHPVTAAIMGHARGVICLLCAQRKIGLAEYPVKRIRSAVTGNGNSTKLQTRSVVAHMLKVDATKLTLDASDAIALGLGHIHIMRCKI